MRTAGVPMAALAGRRKRFDARSQGQRRAGALAGGEDRVAPLLLQGERRGERRILGSPRLDPPALVGVEVSVDVGDKRRLVVSREFRARSTRVIIKNTPAAPLYSLPADLARYQCTPFIRWASAIASPEALSPGPSSSPSFFLVDSGNTLYAMCRIWSTAFGASA